MAQGRVGRETVSVVCVCGGAAVHTYMALLQGYVWVWREMQISFQALFRWGHSTKHALLSSKKAESS